MNATKTLNTACIFMISYHLEQTTKEEFITQFNGKQLWEKPQEVHPMLDILLESQKVMDFSKFVINMN